MLKTDILRIKPFITYIKNCGIAGKRTYLFMRLYESNKKYHTFGITYVRGKSESQALGLTSSDGYEWVEVGHSGSEKTGNGNVLQSIEYSSGVDPMGKAWTYHKESSDYYSGRKGKQWTFWNTGRHSV